MAANPSSARHPVTPPSSHGSPARSYPSTRRIGRTKIATPGRSRRRQRPIAGTVDEHQLAGDKQEDPRRKAGDRHEAEENVLHAPLRIHVHALGVSSRDFTTAPNTRAPSLLMCVVTTSDHLELDEVCGQAERNVSKAGRIVRTSPSASALLNAFTAAIGARRTWVR